MFMRLLVFLVGTFIGCGFVLSTPSLANSNWLAASSSESGGSSSTSTPSDMIAKEYPGGIQLRIKMDGKTHDARTAVMQLNEIDARKMVNVKALKLVRQFDAALPPMRHHAGRDAAKEVPGGLAAKAWLGKSGVTHFTLFGPYMKLMPGKYVVIFRLRLMEKATTKGVINVGVADAQSTIIERQVMTSETPVGEWRVFAVPFTAKKNLSTVEFRAWQHRESVAIDRVYLFEVGEADGESGGEDG